MDANESTINNENEGYPLHLEITDTSYINATVLDSTIEDQLPSPLKPNKFGTVALNTIPLDMSAAEENDVNNVKKRRKRDKENSNNKTADSTSATGSSKVSVLGYSGNTNSPSPLQAKISDDFSTCSFVVNLDTSAEAYSLDGRNGKTDAAGESLCADNLSCSMLSCNEVTDISDQIQEFSEEILKRDAIIEKLSGCLELAVESNEEKEKEITRLGETVERLSDDLERVQRITLDKCEEIRSRTIDFEQSSYLNPPLEPSTLTGPSVPQMTSQESQTNQIAFNSIGILCKNPIIEPTVVQEKCHSLQASTDEMRSELTSLKSVFKNFQNSFQMISSEDIIKQITTLYITLNNDLTTLKVQYSKDIDYHNNIQLELSNKVELLQLERNNDFKTKEAEISALKDHINELENNIKNLKEEQENEIQTLQLTSEGVVKNKNDEIRALTVKLSHLEDAVKKFNDEKKKEIDFIKHKNKEIVKNKSDEICSLQQKLEESKRNAHKNNMSSRLSPEGSELETDVSVVDSTSGIENHFHLTRTKMDYLKLTPPVECIDDGEVIEKSSSSDVPNSINEDLKLQIYDLEKKLDSNRKYLDEQTIERENERDEFHKATDIFHLKMDDMKKENDKMHTVMKNQQLELADYEIRLQDALEKEIESNQKLEAAEDEIKSAKDKVYELRDIITGLEKEIDTATVQALDLKEQNCLLSEELDRLELLKREQEEALHTIQDAENTLGADMAEELHVQIQEMTRRMEKKLNEMDNFPWQTRPNSSCSGAISVSTEDVSVREFSYLNRDKECDPREAASLLCDALRRLDTHYDNLIRFEEVIIKKLQDTELRLTHANKQLESLENEKLLYQDNIREQINKIADLECRLDQFRFEPSPSVVTLSGLRSRVASLTEECEQYKGHLELRNIELQQTNNRLAAAQALNEKYKVMSLKTTASQPSPQSQRKPSISDSQTQTDVELTVNKVSTTEACIQTKPMTNNSEDYQYFNRVSLELSTIPGGPAPTYSTPNEIPPMQKSSMKKTSEQNAWSFFGGGDGETFSRTPETARNRLPSTLSLTGPKSVERGSNKSVSFNSAHFKVKQMADQDRGVSDNQLEGEMDIVETSEGDHRQKLQQQSGQGGRQLSTPKQKESPKKENKDLSFKDQVRSYSQENMLEGDDDEEFSNYEDDINGGFSSSEDSHTEANDGKNQPINKTSKSETDKMDSLRRNALEEQIAKLLKRIAELEAIIQAEKEKPEDHNYDQVLIDTDIDFDKNGMPVKGQSTVRDGVGDPGSWSEEIRRLIERIEKDGVRNLSNEDQKLLIRALKESSYNGEAYKAPFEIGDDDTYTYEVKAVTDYVIDEDGTRHRLGTELMGPGEPSQRVAETDKNIAIETLKTQINQLRDALEQERRKNEELADLLAKATAPPNYNGPDNARSNEPSFSSPPQMTPPNFQNFPNQTQGRSNVDNLEHQVDALQMQLNERIGNEAQLARQMNMAMALVQQRQNEQQELMNLNRTYIAEIQQLQTQLEVAADQLRHRPSTLPDPTRANTSGTGINYVELYLKARSFRKALVWQKKYLTLVILGFKDVLRASGISYDPDLLQKAIPLAPSSVGLFNRKANRFRIVARAIMALSRMKYMVNRWNLKSKSNSKTSVSSERVSSTNSENDAITGSSSNPIEILPARDFRTKSSSGGASLTSIPLRRNSDLSRVRKSSVPNRVPNAAANPTQFSSAPPTTDSVPRQTASGTVLSQYLDRFEYLENQLGNSLGRDTNRPPDKD